MGEPTYRACRACGRSITFARNRSTGRPIPLERVSALYRIELPSQGEAECVGALGLGDLWISHFQTCPQAGTFGREGKS